MIFKNKTNLILMVLGGAIFAWALFALFALRFERGDTYAPYSSYRANPTGCKVLYESLNSMGGIQAERLLRPINEVVDVTDTVMLLTNVSKINNLTDLAGFESYLRRGGNVVIFTAPLKMKTNTDFMGRKIDQPKNKTKSAVEQSNSEKPLNREKDKASGPNGKKGDYSPPTALEKLLSRINHKQRKYPHRMPIVGQPDEQLKSLIMPEIAIYSHGYLTFVEECWQKLYSSRKHTMMITAKYGRGTVIISAASYFISNEAMLKNPPVKLLSWLIGDRHRIIFNELIHGQANQHNIAWLVSKYRLSILLFNLLLVVVLYIWKSFFSTANYRQEEYQDGSSQLSSTFGLAKLLRKNISPGNLLTTCLAEWRKDRVMAVGKQSDAELLEATDPKGRQLKIDYNNIVEAISKVSTGGFKF